MNIGLSGFIRDMNLTRRKALLIGGGLGLTSLSGCSAFPNIGPQLTLTLLNFDSESHRLDVEILRAEGNERSESVVLQRIFELQAPEEGDSAPKIEKPNILESQKYLVRAQLRANQSVSSRYTFYPDCAGGDEINDELYIEVHREDENEEPDIRFQQNTCSQNSWWF